MKKHNYNYDDVMEAVFAMEYEGTDFSFRHIFFEEDGSGAVKYLYEDLRVDCKTGEVFTTRTDKNGSENKYAFAQGVDLGRCIADKGVIKRVISDEEIMGWDIDLSKHSAD